MIFARCRRARVCAQRADSEDASPAPPPQVGTAPDDVYAKAGAANDLIFVKKPDGGLTVSDFHVSERASEPARKIRRMGR